MKIIFIINLKDYTPKNYGGLAKVITLQNIEVKTHLFIEGKVILQKENYLKITNNTIISSVISDFSDENNTDAIYILRDDAVNIDAVKKMFKDAYVVHHSKGLKPEGHKQAIEGQHEKSNKEYGTLDTVFNDYINNWDNVIKTLKDLFLPPLEYVHQFLNPWYDEDKKPVVENSSLSNLGLEKDQLLKFKKMTDLSEARNFLLDIVI